MATTQTISWLPMATFTSSPCPPGKLPLPPMSSSSPRTLFQSPPGTFICLSPAPSHLSSPGTLSIISSGGSGCNSAAKRLRPSPTDVTRCKRRIDFSSIMGPGSAKAASVARRNERERNRVRQVNMGFAVLRDHVPMGWQNKKLSKVDTLRSAMDYIEHLQKLLDENSPPSDSSANSVKSSTSSSSSSEDDIPPPSMSPCSSSDSLGGSLSPRGYSSDASCTGLEMVPSPEPVTPLNPEDFDLADLANWF